MNLEVAKQEVNAIGQKINSNQILQLASENKEEYEFLMIFKEIIKNELMEELDKQIDNFKYFANR